MGLRGLLVAMLLVCGCSVIDAIGGNEGGGDAAGVADATGPDGPVNTSGLVLVERSIDTAGDRSSGTIEVVRVGLERSEQRCAGDLCAIGGVVP